jgi:cycloeucalenol cycloisomerase
VKGQLWLFIMGFIGNYFWTHYFYRVLGATYTFPSYRLNDVPIPMFLATHAYFTFYHAAVNVALRYTRFKSSTLPPPLRAAAEALVVCALAYLTAFLETFTISGFPYYVIADRPRMYSIGSAFYAIYFVVSFPMYFRLDEHPAQNTPLPSVAVNSFAACMIVTTLLDFWRISVGAIAAPPAAAGAAQTLPWL